MPAVDYGLGRRLRQLRSAQSMSLEQVARALKLHVSTIGKYERGERTPSVSILRRIASFYQVDLSDIVGVAPAFAADEAQRLRDRPDLETLVQVARRLTPGQVLLLTDLLRTLTERREGAAGARAPATPARAAEPPGAAWADELHPRAPRAGRRPSGRPQGRESGHGPEGAGDGPRPPPRWPVARVVPPAHGGAGAGRRPPVQVRPSDRPATGHPGSGRRGGSGLLGRGPGSRGPAAGGPRRCSSAAATERVRRVARGPTSAPGRPLRADARGVSLRVHACGMGRHADASRTAAGHPALRSVSARGWHARMPTVLPRWSVPRLPGQHPRPAR